MTDDDLRAALAAAGVAHLADRAIAETHDEIWITAAATVDPVLGASRIGGAPDLPRGTAWPRHRFAQADTGAWPDYALRELAAARDAGIVVEDGADFALALPFIAQLDLADLAPFATGLPRAGMLWLFADQSTDLGETAGYPHCACACIHASAAVELVRAPPPPTPDEQLPALALAFARGRQVPDLDVAERDAYLRAILPFEQPEPRHAVLARPREASIALMPPLGYTTILRVDSDYTVEPIINFGDAAWLAFALRDDDLAAGRFDRMRAFRWIG